VQQAPTAPTSRRGSSTWAGPLTHRQRPQRPVREPEGSSKTDGADALRRPANTASVPPSLVNVASSLMKSRWRARDQAVVKPQLCDVQPTSGRQSNLVSSAYRVVGGLDASCVEALAHRLVGRPGACPRHSSIRHITSVSAFPGTACGGNPPLHPQRTVRDLSDRLRRAAPHRRLAQHPAPARPPRWRVPWPPHVLRQMRRARRAARCRSRPGRVGPMRTPVIGGRSRR
jgi:hypothetical protein